jgi:hypothetical protein
MRKAREGFYKTKSGEKFTIEKKRNMIVQSGDVKMYGENVIYGATQAITDQDIVEIQFPNSVMVIWLINTDVKTFEVPRSVRTLICEDNDLLEKVDMSMNKHMTIVGLENNKNLKEVIGLDGISITCKGNSIEELRIPKESKELAKFYGKDYRILNLDKTISLTTI